MTSVTIPNGVTSIELQVFYGCSNLKTITIGNDVSTIRWLAFANCPELTDVYCYTENVPIMLDYKNASCTTAFENSYIEYATLHVPANSINLYQELEPWKNFRNIVKIDTPDYTLTYIVDEEVYKTYQLEEGISITPEDVPTKEGYTFSGWSEIPETMPAHDVAVTGSFTINSYKLTYIIDDEVYKEIMYEYGAAITPEPQPEGDYQTFEWINLPETMPAYDVVVHASYTSGIEEILMTEQRNVRIYSPDGKKHNKLQKGFNIVILDDGAVKKIIMK